MELDYGLIKEILVFVKNESDGFSVHRITEKDVDNFSKQAYHYKILIDNKFIDGDIKTMSYKGSGYPQEIAFKGLALEGHKLLEALENNNIWNKIKKTVIDLGIEGLKQIPALALTLLTQQ